MIVTAVIVAGATLAALAAVVCSERVDRTAMERRRAHLPAQPAAPAAKPRGPVLVSLRLLI